MHEGEIMTTYDFVHLVIHASGGNIQGRTKLQKIIYFVGALTGSLDELGYRPHYYGPYSAEVSGAVQELRDLKFLAQTESGVYAIDGQGFEIVRYDYVLTEEGKEVAEEKKAKYPSEWTAILKAVEKVNSANVQDYVRLAIASKAFLLTKQAGKVLSPDALRAKTSEKGWGVTPEQYKEALKFLDDVGLNPIAAKK
jgi:uncharacterized protein